MKPIHNNLSKANTAVALTLKGLILFMLLVPAGAFAQDATWFVDVTQQVKLDTFSAGGGIMGMDVNNDGYPDLFSIGSRVNLFINSPGPDGSNPHDRVFEDSTANSGLNLPGQVEQLAAAADFNNDGNIDVIVSAWYQDLQSNCSANSYDGSTWKTHLLLGDGHGHFTLKANSGLEALGPMSVTSLPILDFDKDGNLDIFIGTHYSSWCGTPLPNYLMKGNGDGTFTDVSSSSNIGSVVNPLFGGNIADWNNDCNQDILTAPYLISGYGNLWKNNGNSTFTDVGQTAGYDPHWLSGAGQGMVPWAAMPCDYDNDGDIDFLLLEVHGGNTAGEGRTTILTNQGAAGNYALVPELDRITRKDPQSSSHGDHDGWWLDFDNDGWQDMIIGESGYQPATDRMYFLKQDGSHNFIDITKELGFMGTDAGSIKDIIREPTQMISMDYDLDGDMDFFKSPYYSQYPFLALRNDAANANHHIEIKLTAPAGVNKSCVGARVTVKAGGIKQQQDIYAGEGNFASQQSPFTLVFGLGSSTKADSIDVRWPDANCTHTVVKNVPANQYITISKNGYTAAPELKTVNNEVELYPNPATEKLTLHSEQLTLNSQIEIKDLFGRTMLIQTITSPSQQATLDVSHLSAGVYLVTISNKQGMVVKKLVKE